MKLLLVIPYWDGDRLSAEAVAVQAANLLSKFNSTLGILMVGRNDARAVNSNIMSMLKQKFGFAEYWRCDRRGVGFPMGPNEVYFGIFSHAMDKKSKLTDFDAMLVIESDCVLLKKDWHLDMTAEWNETVKEKNIVAGAKVHHGYDDFPSHINAAALYKRSILEDLPMLFGCSGNIGWDWYFGRNIIPRARDSKLFCLDYQKETISKTELLEARDKGVVVYHGVKDDSARDIIDAEYDLLAPVQKQSIEEWARDNNYSIKANESGEYILKQIL